MEPNELPEEFQAEPKKTDIHECMALASSASKAQAPMVNFSVRLPSEVKDQAIWICERNAPDLGTFLRECAKSLIRDYGADLNDEE